MKALKIFALAMLMVLVAVPFAGAQTITWKSSFTVVNLGTSDATVTVTFYNEAGAEFTPIVPFVLPPGGSQAVILEFVAGLPEGRYSVVLSADQPIVAIANLQGNESPNIEYNASYSGSEDVGQTIAYLPSVSNAFYDWYSHLSIQNLTGAAMDVTVDFYDATGVIASATGSVPAYASWHLDSDDAAISPALPADYNGSATIEAPGPVAVINNDLNFGMSLGGQQAYTGAIAGATTLYCPGLYDQFLGEWISSLNIQNIGDVAADVTIFFSDDTTVDVQIEPNASYLGVYWQGTYPGFFSARVVGTQPLVVIANASKGASSQTYECAPAGATELRSPIAMKWLIDKYNTGFQVQNITATPTNICIEYEGGVGAHDCQAAAAYGVVILATSFSGQVENGYLGAARVYSDPPVAMVGITNQNNEAPGDAAGDFALSFTMFVAP